MFLGFGEPTMVGKRGFVLSFWLKYYLNATQYYKFKTNRKYSCIYCNHHWLLHIWLSGLPQRSRNMIIAELKEKEYIYIYNVQGIDIFRTLNENMLSSNSNDYGKKKSACWSIFLFKIRQLKCFMSTEPVKRTPKQEAASIQLVTLSSLQLI